MQLRELPDRNSNCVDNQKSEALDGKRDRQIYRDGDAFGVDFRYPVEKVPRKENELPWSVRNDDIGLDVQGAAAGETPDPNARLAVVVVPVIFRSYR